MEMMDIPLKKARTALRRARNNVEMAIELLFDPTFEEDDVSRRFFFLSFFFSLTWFVLFFPPLVPRPASRSLS